MLTNRPESGPVSDAQRHPRYPADGAVGTVVWLSPQAPAKPAAGEPCNGCGVCCAWQPCPLGVLVSGRRHGACAALLWHEGARLYRCAMVQGARARWPALPRWAEAVLARLARRWIAAGAGCDCDAAVEVAGT